MVHGFCFFILFNLLLVVEAYANTVALLSDAQALEWYVSDNQEMVETESLNKIIQTEAIKKLQKDKKVSFLLTKGLEEGFWEFYNQASHDGSKIMLTYPALRLCNEIDSTCALYFLGHELGHANLNHGYSWVIVAENKMLAQFVKLVTEFEADIYAAVGLGRTLRCFDAHIMSIVARHVWSAYSVYDKKPKLEKIIQTADLLKPVYATVKNSSAHLDESFFQKITEQLTFLEKNKASLWDFIIKREEVSFDFANDINRCNVFMNEHPKAIDRLTVLRALWLVQEGHGDQVLTFSFCCGCCVIKASTNSSGNLCVEICSTFEQKNESISQPLYHRTVVITGQGSNLSTSIKVKRRPKLQV